MSAVIALNFLVLLLVSGQVFGQDDAETTTTTPAPIVIKSFLVAVLYRIIILHFSQSNTRSATATAATTTTAAVIWWLVRWRWNARWYGWTTRLKLKNKMQHVPKEYFKLKIQSKTDIPPPFFIITL